MTIQIIPAIIAKDFNELKNKIRQIEPYFSIIQLDVMDGKFVPNGTFRNVKKIRQLARLAEARAKRADKTSLRWEIHLMANKPEEFIYTWSFLRPKRFIFHFEAAPKKEIKSLIQKIKNYGMEAGLALNPETPISEIESFLPNLDLALLMGVNPGFGGQEFMDSVLPKIKALRQIWPNGNIEVDGGIKVGTAKKCAEAGANILVAGSAIFEAEHIEEAIKVLQDDIK